MNKKDIYRVNVPRSFAMHLKLASKQILPNRYPVKDSSLLLGVFKAGRAIFMLIVSIVKNFLL